MKHTFTLPEFPNSTFEMETSIWTGKPTLAMDGELISRSGEKGRPFLIPTDSEEHVKAYPKPSYLDMVPALEIDGIRHNIVDKLKWYEYVLCLVPLLLVFIGGGLGGAIGGVGAVSNLQIMRTDGSNATKYLKVIAVSMAAYLVYFVAAYLFFNL